MYPFEQHTPDQRSPSDAMILLGTPFNPARYTMAVATVLGVVSMLLLGLTFY